MEKFDFSAPAGLYVSRPRGGGGSLRRPSRGSPMTYKRFATGSDAVQFVIEQMSEQQRFGATIETGDSSFTAEEIRALYDGCDYPLARTATSPANSGNVGHHDTD
jgi:hypothetical protein